MIKFEPILGIPISFDNQFYTLIFDEEEISISNVRRYKVRNLRRYLLNRELKYPEDIYLTYSQIKKRKEKAPFKFDITILPENLLGIEYTKTIPRKVPGKSSERNRIILTLYGSATVVVQDAKEYPKHIHIVKLSKKDILYIPGGYYYQFINTRGGPLVIAEFYKRTIDQGRILKKKRGMACYMICKNAKQEVVMNPAYRHIDPPVKLKSSTFNNTYANSLNIKPENVYCQLVESKDLSYLA